MKDIDKFKILVMSIGSGLGGIETSMINFLRFLSSNESLQIDLYLWRVPGILYKDIPTNINILKDQISPKGIRDCKKIHEYISYFKFRFLNIFSVGTKVMNKIDRDYEIAIAYCQVGHTPYYIIDKISAKKKYFFYHHGSYDANWLRHLVDKIYFGAFDSIITMSEASTEMMKRAFPECHNKIYTCNPLINENNILEKSKNNHSVKQYIDRIPTVVTVARLSPEKGIIEALGAAKILKDRGFNFRWLFIGGGADKSFYQNHIGSLNLNDVCILIGSKDNPYTYMSIATIYVQPSSVESFCITIREAAVLNKPIIASDIPAIREARNVIDNMRLTANDPKSMASAIGMMLSDEVGLKSGKYNTSIITDVNEKPALFLNRLFSLNND